MKKKILILDDSTFMRTLLSDMLTGFNYDVTAVDNGQEACEKVAATRYDMIITDMNMPVMDGLEFTRQVRTYPNSRFVPIVMLSSETDEKKIALAKELGVATFLSKPPKAGQIKAILQVILGKRGSPRRPVKLAVFYGEEKRLSGYTVNMSAGGLFLGTDQPLPQGEELNLQFSLPGNNQPILCRGRVAWVTSAKAPANAHHPPGMGIEFLDLEEERALKTFLLSLR